MVTKYSIEDVPSKKEKKHLVDTIKSLIPEPKMPSREELLALMKEIIPDAPKTASKREIIRMIGDYIEKNKQEPPTLDFSITDTDQGTVIMINGVKHIIPRAVYAPKLRTFLQMADTPDSYSGQSGKFARVNSTETGLDFANSTGWVTSVSGTTNRITVTGTTTPVIDIASNYVGQSSITTLGTVGTGTWQGTTIKPLYGWFGQSMDMQSSTLTGTQNTFPAGLIRWNGASTLSVGGIVAPTTSNFTVIQNASTNQVIQILHQNSGATAINRIITPSGGTMIVNPWQAAEIYYDTTTARCRVYNIGFINSVSSPLVVTSGNLSMPQASSFQSGYVGAAQVNAWDAKATPIHSLTDGGVVFGLSSNIISDDPTYFSYNSVLHRFGVGLDRNSSEATIHAKSDTPETLAQLTGIWVSMTLYTPLAWPNNYTVTQQTGHVLLPAWYSASQSPWHIFAPVSQTATQTAWHLYAPTSFSAIDTGSGAGYLINDVIDYRITAYDSTGTLTYSVVNSTAQVTITSVTSDVGLSWTDNTSGTGTISGYFIERQVNWGGYNDGKDVGAVTSYNDDATGWAGYTFPLAPTFTDYRANGWSIDYQIWGAWTDGGGGYIWSVVNSIASMTDDNSGNPFVNAVAWTDDTSGTETIINYRIYRQINWGGYNDYLETTASFTDNGTWWTWGSPPPSPQYPDFIAVGTTRDYIIYQAADDWFGGYIWSPASGLATFTDDSTGRPYVSSVSWSANNGGTLGTITNFRTYRQVNWGWYNEYYENATPWFIENTTFSWSSGGSAPTPSTSDFIANGSTRNYSAYSLGTAPNSTTIFSSAHYDVAFMDNNSGQPYVIYHDINPVGGTTAARVLNTDLTTYADFAFSGYEDLSSPFVGGSTVTPNSYGIVSNGTALNRDYDFYNYNGTIYSPSSGIVSTVDPNDWQSYYNIISFSGVSTSAKILRQVSGGGYADSQVSASSPILDDWVTPFAGNTTVTPNTTYWPAGLWETHGTSLSDAASGIFRSLDGDYARIEFQDNTNAVLGTIEQSAGTLKFTSSNNYFSADSWGVAIYTSTGQAQVTGDTIAINALSSGSFNCSGLRFGFSSGGSALYAPSGGAIGLVYNSSYLVQVDSAGVTLNSVVNIGNATNMTFGTSTGTKIGTATNQKLGFWNTTPIVQPTTSFTTASFTANSGTAVNDASTFDGYTLKQVVKILRSLWLLA